MKTTGRQKPHFSPIASIFSSLIATVLACIYVRLRFGFGDLHLAPVLTVWSISLLILNADVFSSREQNLNPHWATLAVLCGLGGLVREAQLHWLLSLVSGAGVGCFLFNLARLARHKYALFQFVVLAVAASGVSFWAAGNLWNTHYMSPYELEHLFYFAKQGGSTDTDFFGAVMQMFQTFGRPSTGLDGAPYFGYHTGGLWLLAQLSSLTSVHSMIVLSLGYPLLILPLLFLGIIRVASLVYKRGFFPGRRVPEILLIVLSALLVVGVLPRSSRLQAFVLDPEGLDSQSFGIALVFFIFCCEFLLRNYFAWNGKTRMGRIQSLITIPFLYFIACSFKIPLAFLLLGLMMTLVVRHRDLWKFQFFVPLLACAALFPYLAFHLFNSSHVSVMTFSIYSFRREIPGDLAWVFPFANFSILFIATWIELGRLGVVTVGDAMGAFIKGRSPLLEAAWIFAGLGSSVFYFLHFWGFEVFAAFQPYCSLLVLLPLLAQRIEEWWSELLSYPNPWSSPLKLTVLPVFAAALAMGNAYANCKSHYQSAASQFALEHGEFNRQSTERFSAVFKQQWLALIERLTRGQYLSEENRIAFFSASGSIPLGAQARRYYDAIVDLNARPLQQKREYVVYKYEPSRSLSDESYLWSIPAWTGFAEIGGLKFTEPLPYNYGYTGYDDESHRFSLSKPDRAQICQRALRKGFKGVIFFYADREITGPILESQPCT